MGKRKSTKNKNKNIPEKSKNWLTTAVFVGVIASVLTGVYFYTQPQMATVASNPAPAFGQLIETRPVLNHAMFSGKAALAYRYAAEIPKVLDSQFCYCYCKKEHNHKNLLTCFTSTHGSKCGICMDEVIHSYKLYKEGKSLDEIVVAIDKKFYRPHKRRI